MRQIICQVCGYEPPAWVDPQEELKEWCISNIGLVGGILQVLACPKCAILRLDQIFDGYKKRIREGHVPEYH